MSECAELRKHVSLASATLHNPKCPTRDTILLTGPRTALLVLGKGTDRCLSVEFSVTPNYPKIPPLGVMKESNLPADVISKVEKRLAEYRFLRENRNWIQDLVEDLRNLIATSGTISTSESHFPDAIEASKLIIESYLNKGASEEWMREQTQSFSKIHPLSQNRRSAEAFMVYCLYRACKGEKSFDECLDFLINKLHVIQSPGPPMELINTIVCRLLEEGENVPSYVQDLLLRSEDDDSPTKGNSTFFSDFSVISVRRPSVIIARNRVDRRIYAVKVIVMNETNEHLIRSIAQLTPLQHRYIVRYYNSWIDESNEEESCAISQTFCLSPAVNTPARFLFIQMDYCEGKSLEQCFKDADFFNDTNTRVRIGWQILEALHYLHSHSFVHNAISSDNIFIESTGNVRLGDFSDITVRPQGFYADPMNVANQNSDMFAFGVLYFELWHPFKSEEERHEVLERLMEGQVPAKWEKVFPVQATIVKLLVGSLPEGKSRPLAIDLLQSKLIASDHETNADTMELEALTRAISSGTVTLENASEVLDALFAESRRLPFRIGSVDSNKNSDLSKGRFEAFAVAKFFNLATSYGATFFHAKELHSLTAEERGTTMMAKDGSLYGLFSSVIKAYMRWIQHNNIKNIRTFSKHTVFQEPTGSGLMHENQILSFDIVSPNEILEDYKESIDFMCDYLKVMFPHGRMTLSISHIGLVRELTAERITSEYHLNVNKLKDIATKTHNPLLKEYCEDIISLIEHFNIKVNTLNNYVIDMKPKRSAGNSIVMYIYIDEKNVAVIGRAQVLSRTKKAEDQTIPKITSARISLPLLLSMFHPISFSKPKNNEIYFVIVTDKITSVAAAKSMPRKVVSNNIWSHAYMHVQMVASQLRQMNIGAIIAPNSNSSVEQLIDEAQHLCIDTVAICYVDAKDTVNMVLYSESGAKDIIDGLKVISTVNILA